MYFDFVHQVFQSLIQFAIMYDNKKDEFLIFKNRLTGYVWSFWLKILLEILIYFVLNQSILSPN